MSGDAAVGGSIESVAVAGRIFPVAADADANRKLGGFEVEVQANGDGTARIVVTRVPWQMDGLALELNDARGDQEYLQDIADAKKFVPCEFTFASGITFRAAGIPAGEIQGSTMNATGTLQFNGPGRLEQ
jgi:hypothetical protein